MGNSNMDLDVLAYNQTLQRQPEDHAESVWYTVLGSNALQVTRYCNEITNLSNI